MKESNNRNMRSTALRSNVEVGSGQEYTGGEIKMTEHRLTLDKIVSWYRSKQKALEGSNVSLVDIRERTEHVPAAAADFSATDTMGRINGWVSGEFDFEVVRISDGKDLFWRHAEISRIEALEGPYAECVQHLLNPDEPNRRKSASSS